MAFETPLPTATSPELAVSGAVVTVHRESFRHCINSKTGPTYIPIDRPGGMREAVE